MHSKPILVISNTYMQYSRFLQTNKIDHKSPLFVWLCEDNRISRLGILALAVIDLRYAGEDELYNWAKSRIR